MPHHPAGNNQGRVRPKLGRALVPGGNKGQEGEKRAMSKAGEGFQRKKNPEGPKEPTMGGGGSPAGDCFSVTKEGTHHFYLEGQQRLAEQTGTDL